MKHNQKIQTLVTLLHTKIKKTNTYSKKQTFSTDKMYLTCLSTTNSPICHDHTIGQVEVFTSAETKKN